MYWIGRVCKAIDGEVLVVQYGNRYYKTENGAVRRVKRLVLENPNEKYLVLLLRD